MAALQGEAYSRIVSLIKHCILATDLTVYFKYFQIELYTQARWAWVKSERRVHLAIYGTAYLLYRHRSEFQEMITVIRDERNMQRDETVAYLRGQERRRLLQAQLMTACDLAACTKQWDIQRRVAYLVTTEFFNQVNIPKSSLAFVREFNFS